MVIRMAVADSDRAYLARLQSVLEGYEDLELSVYTEAAALQRALSSRHFDILLFDSSVYDGQSKLDSNTVAVMLWDEQKTVPQHLQSATKVKKYQRISAIYQQVINFYADISKSHGENVLGSRSVNCLVFYSPIGGAGKTTLALATAATLARRGQQVFYLNLEEFASDDTYLPQGAERGLSEMAASMGSDIDVNLKIQALMHTKSDNFYYMNHFESPRDVREFSDDEIAEFVGLFTRSGLFDYVIVDMDTSLNECAARLFELAQRVILVEKPDSMAAAKRNVFLRQTHILTDYASRMVRVLNFDNGRPDTAQTEIPLVARVGAFQNPDSAQLIEILAGGSAGDFVDRLVGR